MSNMSNLEKTCLKEKEENEYLKSLKFNLQNPSISGLSKKKDSISKGKKKEKSKVKDFLKNLSL